MLKRLLGCPECENNGRRYILGEIAPTGHILIQRAFKKNPDSSGNTNYRNYTIVGGNDFYLICDRCGKQIFFRKVERRQDEINNFGLKWFHSETFNQTTGTIEARSGTN